ncbi:MAG: hypothetical protein RL021_1862 [Bacteroidota bacterium]|jgi:predicted amidohydrolase
MLRITLLQTPLIWENPEENVKMLEGKIHDLPEGQDLIVLPEMFSSGFTMNAPAVAEPMDGVTMQWMRRAAQKTGAVVTGSLVIESDGKHYNRLIWMCPDGNYRHYDKRHLFALAGEENTYTGGNRRMVFEWKGWRIFPLICYDLRFPIWSRRAPDFDYDLLVYVANWPERRRAAWRRLLPARAIENQCYVAAVNRIGEDGNGVPHSGDSVILDYLGDALAEGPAGADCSLQAGLDHSALQQFREQFPFAKDADRFQIQ